MSTVVASFEDDLSESFRPLAAALAQASTVEQVAEAVVSHGLPALAACMSVLALLSEDGTQFYCPRITGYPDEVADAWRRFPATAPVPIAEAVRLDRPVLLGTLEQRAAYYPPDFLLPEPRVGRALAAVPMRQGEVVGGLGFTFPDDRTFPTAEQAALRLTARLCAEALGRVRRVGLGCEVLVVEDEPAVLAFLCSALRYHGFLVRQACGGEAAVRAYQRHRGTVDVVLLDVQMPRLDGPQTFAALRQLNPDVPVVFMSGNTGAYSAEQLRKMGAASVLAKPFRSLDELCQVLRDHTGGCRGIRRTG